MKTIVTVLALLASLSEGYAKPPQQMVEGNRAAPGEFPYVVSIQINEVHICGGTIITDRHVLTAAHCVAKTMSPPFRNVKILAGTVDLSVGGWFYDVRDVLYNDQFNTNTVVSPHDVAVIEVAQQFRSGQYINKAKPPSPRVPTNVIAVAVGWGDRYAHSGRGSRYLHKVYTKIMHPDDCAPYHRDTIYSHQFCTLAQRGGTCQGDSGGPLVWNGLLIGVISWNVPCAQGIPDVYVNVDHYVEFIDGVISQSSRSIA